jgi:hypothetical protein
MPGKQGQGESLPNRSRPETYGRALSIDEKKGDVVRLRKIARALITQRTHLEALFDYEMRDVLQRDLTLFAAQIEQAADARVDEIRAEVFKGTGDTFKSRSYR